MKKILFIPLLLLSFCCALLFGQPAEQLTAASAYTFELYKQIHQNPELGKKETKTSKLIRKELKASGYTQFYKVEALKTCVITELNTGRPGPVIALRAEMDARPGKEETGLPYASKNDQVMHSCGHDAHTSILLGTAKLFMQNKDSLKGRIIFVFQPAEEVKGGADDIVKSGILDSLGVQKMYALHSVGGMDVGTVSISPGSIMAGSNYFTIGLKGKGSHAAIPFEGSYIPLLSSHIVQNITSIPAVRMDLSNRPCVISVAYIYTGKRRASNVIPDTATIRGTIRAYEQVDQPVNGQPSIQQLVDQEVNSLCAARNTTASIRIRKGSPPTTNNQALYEAVVPPLSTKFSGNIDTTPFRSLFSEDFAYYTPKYPCLYFGLGVKKGELGDGGVHTSKFSVHPDAFIYGIELFYDLVQVSQ